MTLSFDAIATLDDICLEADGSWFAVKLEKKATGIAQDGAGVIATPQRSGASFAILTYGLLPGQPCV